MKFLDIYKKLNLNSDDDVFNYLIANLKPSNTLWNYFVNWEKVFKNAKLIEIELNLLNYLIGKENFNEEFRLLAKQHPKVIKAIPALLVRNGDNKKVFDILVDYSNGKLTYRNFDFSKDNYTDSEIEEIIEFVDKTGLKSLFVDKKVKNLVDYIIGVEAGLDSNGRKNRGGTAMEKICEAYIKQLCEKNGYRYLPQANASAIKTTFGYDVPVDKSSRIYDFAINTPNGLVIVEVNYYGGGGSKLKATAFEYKGLQDVLRDKFKFVWITDGAGWTTTTHPLRETFNNNDHLVSLELLEHGVLEEILSRTE